VNEIKTPFTQWAGFQDRQKEAWEAVRKYKYTLFGGARSGGKSYFLRWMAVWLLLHYKKDYGLNNVRVGLFCEDYPSLYDRQISKIELEFPKELGEFHHQSKEFRLVPELGGGVICFRNLDDISKYLSAEFAAILVDELTRNERKIFDFLLGSMRWKGVPDTKFIAATNPGGSGHAFVKKLWIDRDFSNEGFNPAEFTFVKSLYKDNKYIDPSYASQLAALPEKLRKAYMDGDWNVFAGQFFSEWRDDIHTCEPFEIPESWPTVIGLDYGYAKSAVAEWMAYDRDFNRFYVFDEISAVGMTYEKFAEKIKAKEHKTRIISADPAIFAKKDSPVSGDMEMGKVLKDFRIYPANNDRVIGWGKVREHLALDKEGNPKLKVFKGCRDLIVNLPTLVYSEIKSKGEDLETESNDHSADALRYGIMYFKDKIVKTNANSYDLGAKSKKIDDDFDIFDENPSKLFDF